MKLLVCALFLMMVNTALAQQPLERIAVNGNQFIDQSGKVVLRGYNASDPDNLEKQGQWGRAYFQEMKAWGANVVRFPIHPRAWGDRGESAYIT